MTDSCHKCGRCCLAIPFTSAFFEAHKHLGIREVFAELPIMINNIFPLTYDKKCIFLKFDGTCAVYEDRPETCRNYSCSEQGPGHMVWYIQIDDCNGTPVGRVAWEWIR